MHRLDTALAAFAHEAAHEAAPEAPVEAHSGARLDARVARLVAAVRPQPWESPARGAEHFGRLVEQLEADSDLRARVSAHLLGWTAGRRMTGFFTDSGILPATGFYSEGWRRIVHRVLPEVPDPLQLRDCIRLLFDHDDDWAWLEGIPQDLSQRFWYLLTAPDVANPTHWRAIAGQLLDALLVLAHRVSGIGFDHELMRAMPEFEAHSARFTGLAIEVHRFGEGYRAMLEHRAQAIEDERQILVLCDQCTESLDRVHRMARTQGTSLHLTYLLERGQASLRRIECIARLLGSPLREGTREPGMKAWADLMREAVRAETRRNSLGEYVTGLTALMALRVTDNAARSGEHYIAESRADYWQMWRSAMGAGVIIGMLALIKIGITGLPLPLAFDALLYSLNYGLGFVLIYLLHFTIATKQPAMTAQTLAAGLAQVGGDPRHDTEGIVDMIAAVCRSQIAAILGNIVIALPTAVAISEIGRRATGKSLIDADKAWHLLHDLDPLGWAIPHAALAGVFLFLSGVITGYFDNKATYAQIGRRVAQMPLLLGIGAQGLARRLGQLLDHSLGGIMGNLLFGAMLGCAGVIGVILGLPIDIRHIAFSSANLGYAIAGLDYAVPVRALVDAGIGVALIGITNLGVSFALALWMALRARRVTGIDKRALFMGVIRRLMRAPASFLMPGRA